MNISSIRHTTAWSILLCRRLLIPSLLLPQLVLAAAGCIGGEEGGPEEGTGDEVAATECKTGAAKTVPILVYDPSKQGRVRATLAAAGANFVTAGYDAVLVDVDAANASSLAPVVTRFLGEGKHIVLDSSGSAAERAAIGELAGSVAGMAAQETALSIIQTSPDAFTVTPLDTTPTFGVYSETTGNLPLAVLAAKDGSICAAPAVEQSVVGPVAAAADTYLKRTYRGHGQPYPKVIHVLVDNKAVHQQTGFTGSELKRYLYRGDLQLCPSSGGSNFCNMTWGESYSKAIAHGTSISVKFPLDKIVSRLTGDVTLGYSLTITNTRTLTWSNSVNIARGYTARPVSYILRRSGYGNVKNAYVFQSRKSQIVPCRPTLDCYYYNDTYVRQPDTVVGTWLANVTLNQGSPTNSWNVFRGTTDPNSYTFD